MLACWGAFLGLIPPVFLTDEVEGLVPKHMLYAFALGLVGLVVPIITVPNATGTVIKAWSDRAVDVYRMNLRENRPAVEQASARVADYFHQRGLSGADLKQETSRVLGGFATLEGVAHGFRSGLRFLSLMMLTIGLVVAILLARDARGLRHRLVRATHDRFPRADEPPVPSGNRKVIPRAARESRNHPSHTAIISIPGLIDDADRSRHLRIQQVASSVQVWAIG